MFVFYVFTNGDLVVCSYEFNINTKEEKLKIPYCQQFQKSFGNSEAQFIHLTQ